LGDLQNLRKIAYSRDSYQISWHSAESHYELRAPIGCDSDGLDSSADPDPGQERERREKLCEQQHRRRMLLQARGYVRLLPKLQWFYFGQIPMGFADSAGSRFKEAVALSEDRDECWTLLCRMLDGRMLHDALCW
jgi:hypothetical protein